MNAKMVILVAVVLLFGAGFGLACASLLSNLALSAKGAHEDMAKPGPTPIAPGLGFWPQREKRDLDLGRGIFDWPTATPTPAHTALQQSWHWATSIPVFGGLLEGIWNLVAALDWGFRNIWLILVIGFVASAIFRVPPWVFLLILWGIIQTLWTKQSIIDALRSAQKERDRKRLA